MWVWSLCREDPPDEGIATHPSILTWRIPWTEKPGGLQSMGSQRLKWLGTHALVLCSALSDRLTPVSTLGCEQLWAVGEWGLFPFLPSSLPSFFPPFFSSLPSFLPLSLDSFHSVHIKCQTPELKQRTKQPVSIPSWNWHSDSSFVCKFSALSTW